MVRAREQLRRVDRLQRLAVFEAAARLGSFTAAASELGMTQPAVTRHIRLLEQSLGAQLFIRGPNTSSLSDSGRRLSEHIAAGFDVLEAGLAELAETAGMVVLAATAGIAQQVLLTRLDAMAEVLGNQDLRLMIVDRERELADGGFDAAIWVGTGNFAGYDSHPLFPEVVVPVASPILAAEWGLDGSSTAAEVHAAPLLHVDDGGRPWMTWGQWLRTFDITLQRQPPKILLDNYPLVLQQALIGKGVALGWRGVVDSLIESEGLIVVGPEVRSDRAYHLIWPEGQRSEPVEAIRSWLDAELSD
ncbi:MAG: LysR substrate-binding domain-containing protein [Actinomycetota bacterium]